MIIGVTEGYKKVLEINGTGYRVVAKGKDLEFALASRNPVNVVAPAGITFSVERPTQSRAGIDKQLVGEVAADDLRPVLDALALYGSAGDLPDVRATSPTSCLSMRPR